jgi:hypothetical protein
MRKLVFALFVLAGSVWAQSSVPQALQESINLAPRIQRGDSRSYAINVGIFFLDDKGNPDKLKRGRIDFTQICLANNPDSGLVCEIAVDSFLTGAKEPYATSDYSSRSPVDTLMGFSYRSQMRPKIPVSGNCYDIGIPLTTGHKFVEAYDFVEDMMPVRIADQLRFAAGRRLVKVGDTVTIAWPKPICYSIEKVIKESRLEQKPFKLTLSGLTSYAGQPCATIKVTSQVSPYKVRIYSTDTSEVVAEGTSLINGEFLVTLNRGELVNLKWEERTETNITLPNGNTKNNRVLKKTELGPRGW